MTKQDRTELIRNISAAAEATKRAYQARFYKAAEELGFTISHAHMLMMVKQLQPVQQKDLAARMYITPGAISQAIEGLLNGGYLVRKQDEQDRRSAFVSLTEMGMEAVTTLQGSVHQYFTAMLATLTDEELALYQRTQQKMLAYLEPETKDQKGGQCV